MNYLLALSLMIFLALAQTTQASDDTQQITNLIQAYGKAMNASDSDAVMALYDKEGLFMPSGLPTDYGRQAIKTAYEHEFETIDLDVDIIIDEIYHADELAYARTRSLGHLTLLATNEHKPTDRYRALFVLKKRAGRWKIFRFMFNFSE